MKASTWLIIIIIVPILLFSLILVRPQFGTIQQTIVKTTTITEAAITTETVTKTIRQVEDICFSRTSSCDSLITSLIGSARERVLVAVYSFTNDVIAEALINAFRRGVEVKVVIEREQAEVRGSEYRRLLEAGIEVRLDGNRYLMHHKFVVIDGSIVVTGSYNWSRGAEDYNDENIVVLRDVDVAEVFEKEFWRVWNTAG